MRYIESVLKTAPERMFPTFHQKDSITEVERAGSALISSTHGGHLLSACRAVADMNGSTCSSSRHEDVWPVAKAEAAIVQLGSSH